ncbi:MAG: NAD(P)/FAD-dependent oxidoreductase [Candidatus Acidiferrales bacterium]
MSAIRRRILLGILAGAVASATLGPVLGRPLWTLVWGISVGVLYCASLRPARATYVDNLMTGAALGIPLWAVISIIAIPLLSREMPEWSAEQMRAHFPALVRWVLYGASLGVLAQVLNEVALRVFGPEAQPATPAPQQKKRIVILGGGFAGMRTAECLEKQFQRDDTVSITLVSDTNALLFTPMLAEVAGSSLEPSHISTPLRSSLRRTEFIRSRAEQVDLEGKRVILDTGRAADGSARIREIPYDELVLALGSVSNYLGMANIEKLAFNFKSLLDAIRIRNHVIEMFECADREPDGVLRRTLLTFVIAGGGFAGVELAGALNDFAHGILADYPNLHPQDLQVVLVHSRDRILPELSESLAHYARGRMEARGVTFRLNTRLLDANPGVVILSDGEIPAQTLVWTAGTAPHPLLKSLPLEKDKRGAVVVDRTLALPGHPGLWALGDCAAVVDAKTGKPCPPTAQFAQREAIILAKNIRAHLHGQPQEGFHFDSLGALCVVGHQTACAEFSVPLAKDRSVRFSGFFAWLMWRGIYLAKLPGLERKIRVLVDWTIELFFPPDIVQTIDLQ